MGLCHGNQGLSAVCVTWNPAPRAPDGLRAAQHKGGSSAGSAPAPTPQAGGLRELLAQGHSNPSQSDAYPVKGHC